LLKECLEAFEYLRSTDKENNIVIDNYVLDEGLYLLIDKDFNVKKSYEVEKPKSKSKSDEKEEIIRTKDYYMFSSLDYNSILISMNKPIDKKKQIHSNNYFTFFVKKDVIRDKKLTPEIIKGYYDVLLNPELKYKSDKKSLKLYKDYEETAGKVDKSAIEIYKNYILENIFKNEDWVKGKGYLKIFFDASISDYERESKRYIIPNIFNSNFFNEEINGESVGLHGNNMGMNDKKPFLRHMNRKNIAPELISIENALKYKDLFQYLYGLASSGIKDVYISERNIKLENKKDEDFTGIYLRINKGTELEILYCDKIIKYRNKIESFDIENILKIDYEKYKDKYKDLSLLDKMVGSLSDIERLIDTFFFNKYLRLNYFTEASDIKLNDDKIRQMLITYRMFFFRWFKLGYTEDVLEKFKSISIYLLKDTLINDSYLKACAQFNIIFSIINYLERKEENMADIRTQLYKNLSRKVNSSESELEIIENDKEYYFALGQIVNYLNSINKSKNKDNLFLKQVLESNTNERTKEIITRMIKKYAYSKNINRKRFRNLGSMVMGYIIDTEEKDDFMIILGYLNNNVIYEKKDDKSEIDEDDDEGVEENE